MNNIGYACINMTLAKDGIKTGRTCRKATFEKEGLDTISSLVLQNVTDLKTILEWNFKHDYKLFRMGSGIFPWLDFYNPDDLPDIVDIKKKLRECGDYATECGMRLTFHPGPFNVLASDNPDVADRTVRELDGHSLIFDWMGFTPSHYNKINIHLNTTRGGKDECIRRFANQFKKLHPNTKKRLVIENDDKPNQYSVKDLMQLHEMIGIPITFDYYHHKFNTGGLTEEEALRLAYSTWPTDVTPCTHYSESRREEQKHHITMLCEQQGIPFDELNEWPTFKQMYDEFSKIRVTAHSDYISGPINTYGLDHDIVIEAKAKELAVENLKNSLK